MAHYFLNTVNVCVILVLTLKVFFSGFIVQSLKSKAFLVVISMKTYIPDMQQTVSACMSLVNIADIVTHLPAFGQITWIIYDFSAKSGQQYIKTIYGMDKDDYTGFHFSAFLPVF